MNAVPFITKQENMPVSYDVDVLVVGGGPAGIAAAVQAGRQNCSVLLIAAGAVLVMIKRKKKG